MFSGMVVVSDIVFLLFSGPWVSKKEADGALSAFVMNIIIGKR